MCGLFGVIDYGKKLSNEDRVKLLKALGVASEVRGTDATGYSFVRDKKVMVHKNNVPASKLSFKMFGNAKVLMGHTRMTTQGNAVHNFNNHPFVDNSNTMSLAHNGVLYNDTYLRKTMNLPNTKIETDSYVALQILKNENAKDVTIKALKKLGESVEGTYNFTVLDKHNNLFILKNNNPLCIYDVAELGCIVYCSTEEILQNALSKYFKATDLFNYLLFRYSKGPFLKDVIKPKAGEIYTFTPNGDYTVDKFTPTIETYQSYSYDYGYDYDYVRYSNKITSKSTVKSTETLYFIDYKGKFFINFNYKNEPIVPTKAMYAFNPTLKNYTYGFPYATITKSALEKVSSEDIYKGLLKLTVNIGLNLTTKQIPNIIKAFNNVNEMRKNPTKSTWFWLVVLANYDFDIVTFYDDILDKQSRKAFFELLDMIDRDNGCEIAGRALALGCLLLKRALSLEGKKV